MDDALINLLAADEDASTVAAKAESIRIIIPHVTSAIGALMIEGEDERAGNLRDYAQQLPAAAELLDRLSADLQQ